MVKINPSVTLVLEKSGQTITIDLDEARQIIKGLSKFVQEGNTHAGRTARAGVKGLKKGPAMVPGMSEAKRNEILKHISKRLSARPRTLSNLLEGVSYVPNNLPLIRAAIEAQGNVSKKSIGKRIYYLRKAK